MEYRVADLFAGVGGISLGFLQSRTPNSRFVIKWGNEIDECASFTYKTNFSHKLFTCDINLILNPSLSDDFSTYNEIKNYIANQPIDVLTAGFPCQAFSIAGYQKGFDDVRGNLFWAIIDTIKLINTKNKMPRILFLENVKNLMSHDKGNTYKVIKSEIEKLGYIVKEKVINTMHYSDLPQNRERIYIVCFRDKVDADSFTLFDNLKSLKKGFSKKDREKQIKELLDYSTKQDNVYYYTKDKYPRYFCTENPSFQEKTLQNSTKKINLEKEINELYQFFQLRRGMYVRKNKNNVCPTLTANMGTGGHNVPLILDNYGIRKLTPKETFKLQGFPVDNGYKLPDVINGKKYAKSYLYKQAGNSVSVPIIKLIADEILNILENNDKTKKII